MKTIEEMNSSGCPQCGYQLAGGASSCLRCGWKEAAISGAGGAISMLVVMILLLMVTGSCAFRSFTATYGDEYGYGKMALVESAILFVTIVWLGIGLSLRSQAPRSRKLAVIRASAGVTLSAIACGIALNHLANQGSDYSRPLLLGLSGLALFVSSFRVLKAKS